MITEDSDGVREAEYASDRGSTVAPPRRAHHRHRLRFRRGVRRRQVEPVDGQRRQPDAQQHRRGSDARQAAEARSRARAIGKARIARTSRER